MRTQSTGSIFRSFPFGSGYSTLVTLKVMLSIYFHGSYSRYEEHNKHCLIEQILSYRALLFSIVTTISYAFLPVMHRNLHVALVTIDPSKGDPLSLLSLLKCTTHHLTVFTFSIWSSYTFRSVNACQWVPFFSTWRNSMPHLCFRCTSMPDTIL